MSAKRKLEDLDEKTDNKQKVCVVEKAEPNDASDNENGSKDGLVSAGAGDNGKHAVVNSEDCGTVLICGGMNWDLTGRKSAPKGTKGSIGRNLWSPHLLASLEGVRVRLVASGCTACHCVLVTDEGRVMTWGRNEKGQLGSGDTTRCDVPTLVETLKNENIVAAACGRAHTLFLTDRGEVFACGDNKLGQCGVGNQHPMILTPTRLSYKGPPIIKLGCGGEFSMILDIKGILHSFGCPEYGQLGHNTDGKYFVSCNKLGYHCETAPKRIVFFVEKAKDGHITPVEVEEIVDFSCGANHSVAVDVKKRVFSWGWGGLGRLGHAEQKDEMIPRLIKFFDSQSKGVKKVFCGSSYSLALNEHGVVYLFGQTKRTGEANMYPKPIQDLSGWAVRSVACGNTSIVMAADDSVIAWGPSPTYGELGFGENQKTSSCPMEVKKLDGIYIKEIVCATDRTERLKDGKFVPRLADGLVRTLREVLSSLKLDHKDIPSVAVGTQPLAHAT